MSDEPDALKALRGRALNPLYREPPLWLFNRDAYGDGRAAAVARLYGYLARRTALEPEEAFYLAVEPFNAQRCKPPLSRSELVEICAAVGPWKKAPDPDILDRLRRLLDDGSDPP